MIPCVLYEDEHLLVVNKPAGINTHAPAPYAGEGIYDWLRHREPRWSRLAIIHRLDKETSGILAFGKTAAANRSLTKQFTDRTVHKRYVFLTDRPLHPDEQLVKSRIVRAGERYISRAGGQPAETRFRALPHGSRSPGPRWVEAEPLTGRTHQIRVHAAEKGFPILGDSLYGGPSFSRLCLHAANLEFRHPVTGENLRFEVSVDFFADARLALRLALIDTADTNAFRVVHGAADGWPGWYVDRLGNSFLSQSESSPNKEQTALLQNLLTSPPDASAPNLDEPETGAYHKTLHRRTRELAPAEASPRHILGATVPDRFVVHENGLRFELSFHEGYSAGLFLDQRDNRRRLLTGHVAAQFPLFLPEKGASQPPLQLLNTFAYTCGFSVCAAKAGARTLSLDLSKKYLEWGKRNFSLNDLEPSGHEFIFGDVFDWLRRLAKKNRWFDVILVDPPTFSQSREHGPFRIEKDLPELLRAALAVLKPGGVLFASSNAAGWGAEQFLATVNKSVQASGRKISRSHYVPQPPDFPVCAAEPAYLKTIWMRID